MRHRRQKQTTTLESRFRGAARAAVWLALLLVFTFGMTGVGLAQPGEDLSVTEDARQFVILPSFLSRWVVSPHPLVLSAPRNVCAMWGVVTVRSVRATYPPCEYSAWNGCGTPLR
ncbi:MAG: hypothetical protein QHJ73_01845 [Armatimonadota bacterium]|nr:hypothetical protein [Armatimonadota bacterium]